MQSCCCNMLLTLGLIFLLSPFATFQSITSDKRDTGGSNVNKANAVFNLSKLKTTAVPSKQSFNSTQKPNTLTVTTLPTAASNHKSTTANPVTTSKSKLSVAVVETTASLAKSPTATNTNINRGKHKSNKSLSAKLLSLSEEKPSKDKPGPTGAPKQQLTIKKLNTLKTIKNKSQHDDEQMLTKSPSTSDTKNVKDRLNHNVHSISSGGIKTTKEKFLTSGNQTHLDSPLTSSDEKSKDKSAQSLPSLPAIGSKTTQDKAKVSVKQAIAHKHLTKVDEKFKRKSTPSVLSLPGSVKTLQDKDTISNNQTIFDTSLPSNDKKLKDKHPPNVLPLPTNGTKTTKDKPKFGNKTIVDTHLPSNDEKTKDKPGERDSGSIKDKEMGTTAVTHTRSIQAACNDSAPSQSIRVVISNDGDLSHTKKQEMTLKPGAPLVMTHRINLIPGGCSRGCEAEMDAVKARLTRLEKEMSSLKKKCPCSANCPNDCGDKGKCEHGKCICSKGFIGLDCSKCAKDIECSKGHEKKNTSTKTDTTTTTFVDQNKDSLNKKVAGKDFSNNSTTSHNSPSNSDNEKLEEASRGETENTTFSTTTIHKIRKEGPNDRLSTHLQDDPLSNITLIGEKKTNSTSKRGNESKSKSHENPSLTNKNVATKPIETDKTEKKNDPSIHNRTTTTSSTKDNTDVLKNNTGIQHSPRKPGGLGSVKAVNISSSSFTITWLAPHHMFKNFTVIRREIQTDSDKDKNDEYGEEIVEIDSFYVTRNSTEIQNKGSNTTLLFGKGVLSRGQTETKSISRTLPGSARSFEFKNLKANTRYVVHVFGSTAHRRSKIQGVTASTGPDPPTELVFSNVTESSLTVSWTKPNTIFTGFKVTYNNIATGKSQFVTVEPQQSSVVLSALSVGSSYNISVTTYKGRTQSDELTSIITTVPAPPTHLQVINVTDNKAMLHWTPSLGKVDRFIISYESSKTPNVTVTVMVSGNSVQYQLKALQKGTLYNVKVRTQKNNLKSMGISTTFTTANVVKASEIGARSAVISWKKSVALCRYKVIYQAGKEKPKEAILEPKITEYKLMGLMPSSSYFVVVQGEKNGKYISLVTSQFITGKLRFPFPTECSQELLNGALESGEVNIYPQGKEGQAVRVYCDMETDGGGWTVFQRRINGKTDFYRTWDEYKIGFGNLSEEFWLGNEPLHNLTSVGPVSLRVDLKSGNDTAYARYTNFSVASEARNYTLSLSGYTGTAGDSLRYHNGRPFSTIDKEPDPQGIHCAKAYVGGWWYKNCYKVNLNGLYGMNSNNQGIVWIDWKGKDSSIPFSEMKFRPSRFSPATHG